MIKTNLAGVQKDPEAKVNIQELREGMVLDMVSYTFEKGSYVDENAVKVLNKGKLVGHIPAKVNKQFSGNACKQCRVTNVMRKADEGTDGDYSEGGFVDDESVPVVGITIEADLVTVNPEVVSSVKPNEQFELKQSFNEDVAVEFYPVAHKYFMADTQLGSVTREKGKMYKPFDNNMANNCGSWGIPAQDIKDMWSLNGSCAANIGTGLHGYLEIYQKYGLRMPSAKRDKALPKIKVFRDVVLGFPWTDDVVHTEVLVTLVEEGLCGLIDRAVETPEGIRIEDYKFNAEWDVKSKSKHFNMMFPDLPFNKLSGYLVQLSIYADMLERSGMKVADTVVAHIWDGEWHHEEMGRIHGIIDIINKRK